MMGLEFTGEVPFADVYVHSVIQAPDGRRMSKSLGTGIDPLDEIDAHGADAVRFGLLAMSSTQDVRYSSEKVRQGQALANKLFNAARYVLGNVVASTEPEPRPTTIQDRWILSRLQEAKAQFDANLAAFDFAKASLGLYDFVYGELCDWYLEFNKGREYDARAVGDDAPRPARDAAARAPGHPLRDRGAVVARPRRRGPAGHPAGDRARRQPARPRRRGARGRRHRRGHRAALLARRRRRQARPGAARRAWTASTATPSSWRGWRAWTSTGDGETDRGRARSRAARPRSARARWSTPPRRSASAPQSASGCRARSRAPSPSSPTRASWPRRPSTSSPPSARSSNACDGSSRPL